MGGVSAAYSAINAALAERPAMNRWFSKELSDRFDGGTALECLEWFTGDRLGAGMSREVFRFALDEKYVVKIELIEHRFQNQAEAEVWDMVKFRPDFAKWFAPVYSISGCGRFMLQEYAEPISTLLLPERVPNWFTDLKPGNWGMLNGHPVCVDYGRTLMLQTGLTKRLKRALWT